MLGKNIAVLVYKLVTNFSNIYTLFSPIYENYQNLLLKLFFCLITYLFVF